MTKELKDLEKAKEKLSGLEKQLCDAYASFTIKHANYIERERLQRKERSRQEELELARKEAEEIKAVAETCTALEDFVNF